MLLDVQLGWRNLKNTMNPNIVFKGGYETFKWFGIDKTSTLTNRNMISRNAGQYAMQQQNQQAIKNAEAAVGGKGHRSPIPYAAPNAFQQEIPKVTINSMNKFYFDKDNSLKRQEITSDVMP